MCLCKEGGALSTNLLVSCNIFFVTVIRHVAIAFDGRYGFLCEHRRLGATRYDGGRTLFRFFQCRRQ